MFSFLFFFSLLTWIIYKINQKKIVELNLNVRLEDLFLYMKFILSNETLSVLIIPFKH